MRPTGIIVALLLLASLGCGDIRLAYLTGLPPSYVREQNLLRGEGILDVEFDLSEYRKLLPSTGRVFVGTVVGVRTRMHWRTKREERLIAVGRSDHRGRLRTYHYTTREDATVGELAEHVGKELLFFCGVGSGIFAYFPWDAERRQVMAWLEGKATQHTLFDPASPDVLPEGIRASGSISVVEDMCVSLTNTGTSAVVIDMDCPTHTELIGKNGALLQRGGDEWDCAPPFCSSGKRTLAALPPGASTYLTVFRSTRLRQYVTAWIPVSCGRSESYVLGPGTYHYRFTYDSSESEAIAGIQPLQGRVVVHGTFVVEVPD